MGAIRWSSGSHSAEPSAKRSHVIRKRWDNSELRDMRPPIQAGVLAVDDFERRTLATSPWNETKATVCPAKTKESPSFNEATKVSSTWPINPCPFK